MSEGREVLGYTLILRPYHGRDRYPSKRGPGLHTDRPAGAWRRSTSELLRAWPMRAPSMGHWSSVHIGRVVRIPGEQTVEVLTEPEDGCEWGVRSVECTRKKPWRGPRVNGMHATPQPMDYGTAREVLKKEYIPCYLVPLRVTNSEPRTVVEEVECE